MNDSAIRVSAGPDNYYSSPGSISRLADFFDRERLSRAAWVYGRRAMAAARPYVEEFISLPGVRELPYGGHCTDTTLDRFKAELGDDREVIIGVGGGAVLDTAKALARRMKLPFVAIPTIAATCAAWTPLSVWYDDAGHALHYTIFDQANFLVLVEPKIILEAPEEYLLAGIGDTLVKWYEAVVLAPRPETLPLSVRLGIGCSLIVRDELLAQSETALRDKRAGELSQAFLDVVDAIIAGGGVVGGLGERFTRVAAAHAFHNGLTVLPQTGKFLHGTKVAYGLLVQCALMGQDEELAQLVEAYGRFNLPTRLAQLGVDVNDRAELDQVIAHTLRPIESIHFLPIPLSPEVLLAAIQKVEACGAHPAAS